MHRCIHVLTERMYLAPHAFAKFTMLEKVVVARAAFSVARATFSVAMVIYMCCMATHVRPFAFDVFESNGLVKAGLGKGRKNGA